MECQQASASYEIQINLYRSFLVGVPAECGLPDPIAI
jgi:hypothetical protein